MAFPNNMILYRVQTIHTAPQRAHLRAHSTGQVTALVVIVSVMASVLLLYGGAFDDAYAGSSGSAQSELLLINDAYHAIQIKTSPAILSEKNEPVLLVLSMENVDDADSAPVSGVLYNLRFSDGPDSATTLADFDVYSTDAQLPIMILPTDDDSFDVYGDSFEDGLWMSTDASPLALEAPIFLSGGIVYIHATIMSIESQPVSAVDNTFEIMFSMGEYIPFAFDIDGTVHNVMFATYFDEISKFEYNEQTRSLSAEMPFTWTSEYIEGASFIHAEYFIPKTIELFEDNEILLAVNGVDYFGTVDRSGEDEIVIHYLLSAAKLYDMLASLDSNYADRIVFEMRAGEMRQHDADGSASLESGDRVVITSTGGHHDSYTLSLDAEPAGMIHPKNKIVLSLEIRDADSDELVSDAAYDLELLFGDDVLIPKAGRAATGGSDVITATFEKPGIATLKISDIQGTGAGGKFTFVVSEAHDMSSMHGGGGDGAGDKPSNDTGMSHHGGGMGSDGSKDAMNMDEMNVIKDEMDAMVQEHDAMMREHDEIMQKHDAMMMVIDDSSTQTDIEQYMVMIEEHKQIIAKHNEIVARHKMMISEHEKSMAGHDAGMMMMMEKDTGSSDEMMSAMHDKMQLQHQAMEDDHALLVKDHTRMLMDHDMIRERYESMTTSGGGGGADNGDDVSPVRNDTGNGDGGGCLIATAAFGSELAPQVQQLRDLRDNTVLATASGTAFMSGFNQVYYAFSPAVSDLERENPAFKSAVRVALVPMLSSLSLLNHANIDTESEMLGYGLAVIVLNVGMYIGAPTFAIILCARLVRARLS